MAKGSKKGKSGRTGFGCLLLFALPFAAVGVVMTVLLAVKLLEHRRMAGWEVVPATILSVDLERHDGDDGATYKAVATYRYDYGGKTYHGDRVGLHGGSDNVGSFQKQAAAKLREHLRSKQPFLAKVDPEAPEDSILFTDLRLGMVAMYSAFGLIFGSVGFGMLVGGVIVGREEKAVKARKERFPDSPWEWGEGWGQGRIKSSGAAKMWVLAVLAVFWISVCVMVMASVWDQVFDSDRRLGLLFLLLPAAALLIGLAAFKLWARHRKFGVSIFEMASVPGVVGGSLAGAIVTNRHLLAEGGFDQRLICEVTRKDSDGNSSSSAVWEDERVLTGELMADDRSRSAVPVLFQIPHDQPATDTDSNKPVTWKLRMEASVPGVDYYAEFKVPVFKTAESREDFELDESPIAHLCMPNSFDERLRRAGAKVRELGDGVEIAFPMLLNRGAFFSMAAFTVVWIGVTLAIWKLGAPAIFPIVFGGFALLMVAMMLPMVFSNKRLEIRGTELVSSGGLARGEKRFPLSDLKSVTTQRGMASGDRVYFSVLAKDKQGRSATLTPNLRPASTAEALAEEIRRRQAAAGV